MAEPSILAAAITAIGPAVGALSVLAGVALTNRAAARKEEREGVRRRLDERRQAREQAYTDLLGGARKLRLRVETAAQHVWDDMNVRLAAIEEQAGLIGDLASKVAILTPGDVATAARALSETAYALAGHATRYTRMDYDADGQLVNGEMTKAPDFDALDACLDAFYRTAVDHRDPPGSADVLRDTGVAERNAGVAEKPPRLLALVRRQRRGGRREG